MGAAISTAIHSTISLSIGAISVIYGTSQGPKKADQLWKQGENGLLGVQELTEGFGWLENSPPG